MANITLKSLSFTWLKLFYLTIELTFKAATLTLDYLNSVTQATLHRRFLNTLTEIDLTEINQ